MDPQVIINQFFIEDRQVQPNGRIKRSILLALIEDLQFCIFLPKRWNSLKLTPTQDTERAKIMPTFAILSLFCSGVDLLARVINKRQPPRGQNGDYFKDCSLLWFGLSQVEADQLWLLRNSISHNYSLNPNYIVIQFGHGRLIRQNGINWEFYLHAMYIDLERAKTNIYNHLLGESEADKQVTAAFLSNHGFFYTN